MTASVTALTQGVEDVPQRQCRCLCSNPIVVDSLPFVFQGTTENMGNVYRVDELACPDQGDEVLTLPLGGASDDVFFSFSPSSTVAPHLIRGWGGRLDYADLAGDPRGSCPSVEKEEEDEVTESTCLSATHVVGDGGECLVVDLLAASTYLIVVDGWSNEFDINGGYALRVEAMVNVPVGALAITEVMGNPEGEISDGNASGSRFGTQPRQRTLSKHMGLTYRSWNNGGTMPEAPSAVFIIEDEVSIPYASAITTWTAASTASSQR